MVAITGLTLTVTAAAAAAPIPGKHAVARGAATAASSGAARVQAATSGSLGTSVAVSPNGAEVFVTGEIITVGPPSRPFMATLAYSS